MEGQYEIDQLKKALNLAAALANVGERIGDKNLGIFGKVALIISIKDDLLGMDGFDFGMALKQVRDLQGSEKSELVDVLKLKLDFSPEHDVAERLIEDAFASVVDMLGGLQKLIELFKKPEPPKV